MITKKEMTHYDDIDGKAELAEKNAYTIMCDAQRVVAEAMTKALEAIEALAKVRSENKMSSSRVVAVAKEMKEMQKVMSVYVVNSL